MTLASISPERSLSVCSQAALLRKPKQEMGDNQECLVKSAHLIQI